MLKRLLNILTFTELPIRKKFLLFSIGVLFWLSVIAAIGLISLFEINSKSNYMVDRIVPQERTVNIVVRKLRGASISAHKIALYKDTDVINNHYLKGKGRIEDSRLYLNTLLTGGIIKDYSRGTGQFYEDYKVVPIDNDEKREFINSLLTKINKLEALLDEIFNLKFGNKAEKDLLLIEKLSEYDTMTRDTITILNEYSINLNKEWTNFTNNIKNRLSLSIIFIISAFSFAAFLTVGFGILISRALIKPTKAIIEQIKSLSIGEIDLSKRIGVISKDELGQLTMEFNKLMDTISHVASFKKIIEEDETAEDIYMRLGRIFIDDLKLDNCIIYEVSNSKNTLKIVYPPEAEGAELHCRRDITIDSNLCRVKRTGHLVTSFEYPNICKHYLEGKDDIHVCLPIIIGGNVGGIVQFVCGKRDVCNISDIEKKISRAHQYIREAQPVLEAKRLMKTLKESSVRDTLTGLYNRRFIEESYESLCAGIIRRGSTLGILMCDIDYFKQTNDEYGHDVGDIVLKETATVIKQCVRGSDIVIRFGGEEILVLLLDTKPEDPLLVAEKIRSRVEDMKIRITGEIIQKTISIGVSELPTDTQNFWEAIKFADVALYKAKERGRNRVERFIPEMWTGEKY